MTRPQWKQLRNRKMFNDRGIMHTCSGVFASSRVSNHTVQTRAKPIPRHHGQQQPPPADLLSPPSFTCLLPPALGPLTPDLLSFKSYLPAWML